MMEGSEGSAQMIEGSEGSAQMMEGSEGSAQMMEGSEGSAQMTEGVGLLHMDIRIGQGRAGAGQGQRSGVFTFVFLAVFLAMCTFSCSGVCGRWRRACGTASNSDMRIFAVGSTKDEVPKVASTAARRDSLAERALMTCGVRGGGVRG